MAWYIYLGYLVGGIFLANGAPHFVNGISGRRFQSPFASPPGVGESSPVVNVIWGLINFVIAYLLIRGLGDFSCGFTLDTVMVGVGVFLISIALSLHFGKVRNGI